MIALYASRRRIQQFRPTVRQGPNSEVGTGSTNHAALAPVVDALIAPASPGPAPKIVQDQPDNPIARPTGNSVFNVPSSVLEAPVVNLPLTAVGGLPMGIQILGQPHTDARCAAYARWMLETLTPVIV